ncbi:hypothetical protein BS50DRAFT_673342 [Corynespora cassiicola Philippines]|uniref:DUF1772-domain-containing protein n=1 Tax=Corynespora cassiicola Philippines TaxID=1448308 RepID=A0A2T2P4Q8_CORCC|nr:hypothetical protein BS50DRAFT_673342 [Corynespora cassiicola Philippines]
MSTCVQNVPLVRHEFQPFNLRRRKMSHQTVQAISISTALVAAGGIATLSLFNVPMLKSQLASRSLPMTRWLFSRGSHIFPQAAVISSAGFTYLAYESLQPGGNSLADVISSAIAGGKMSCYAAAAAVLTISIAPFTTLVMIPTNFALIQKNEERGGARSENSAKARGDAPPKRTAEESVDGKNDITQIHDLSGPQEKTLLDTDAEEDEMVVKLLDKFGKLNMTRVVLMGVESMND